MTIAEAAIRTLGRTNNPAVGFGDYGLLHEICHDASRPHRGIETERLILAGLDRRPDLWRKEYFRFLSRWVRVYYPTEKAEQLIKEQFPDWNPI